MAFPKGKKKSGDSKLQDGAAAREKDRMGHVDTGSEEHRHTLVDMVQDSAELKRAAGDTAAAEKTEKRFASLLTVIEGLEKKLISLEAAGSGNRGVRVPERFMKCGTCGQAIQNPSTKNGVCDGEHVFLFVAPSRQELWRSFQGVVHNGVKYIGRCVVSKAIVDEVKVSVSRWERMELQKFIPGGKVYGELDNKYATGVMQPGMSPVL